jgi:hypothetical protein
MWIRPNEVGERGGNLDGIVQIFIPSFEEPRSTHRKIQPFKPESAFGNLEIWRFLRGLKLSNTEFDCRP